MSDTPTPDALGDLLAEILAGAAGGDTRRWRKLIGPVEKLPLATNVRSNWSINPSGTTAELDAISKAAEIVRAEHPYVAG